MITDLDIDDELSAYSFIEFMYVNGIADFIVTRVAHLECRSFESTSRKAGMYQ